LIAVSDCPEPRPDLVGREQGEAIHSGTVYACEGDSCDLFIPTGVSVKGGVYGAGSIGLFRFAL
jgi:hypothetical protein